MKKKIFCYGDAYTGFIGKNNKCFHCGNVKEGGIEGCSKCYTINNIPQCYECAIGYIFLKNNSTCLNIYKTIELQNLPHCEEVFLNSENKIECIKCSFNYILLEENNTKKCYHYDYFFSTWETCKRYINIGTLDQPKFSCLECESSSYDVYYSNDYTRITDLENNISFCEASYKYPSLENCTEATRVIKNGVIINNCTECKEDNILYYHVDTDLNICKYKYFEKECVIKYCKKCVKGNNYFCEECLPSNYKVNPLSGSCIRKTEKPPAVYFKDIFRLQMNQYKQIGAKTYFGPFFSLRGLTRNQINNGHSFLVLLSFKLHYTYRNINLEENKNIKTLCQVVESTDESNEINLVDFDCIGDTEDNGENITEYKLNNIEFNYENNSQVFEDNNLNKLVKKTDLSNLDKKENTSFEIKNFVNLTIFNLDEVKNISSEDYNFNIVLNGKLNKNLTKNSFNVSIPFNQIKDKYANCTFNILENKTANLQCDLDLSEFRDNYTIFSLKLEEIGPEDNPIYLSGINEVKMIYKAREEKEKKNYIAFIIMIIFIFLIIILAIIFYLYRRYKKKKNSINVENYDISNDKKGLDKLK